MKKSEITKGMRIGRKIFHFGKVLISLVILVWIIVAMVGISFHILDQEATQREENVKIWQ